MAAILITRPQPDGEQLGSQLLAQGWSVCYQPLLDFAPGPDLTRLPAYLDTLTNTDIVIAVSRHAVNYASDYLQCQQRCWPTTPHYLAIGTATATCWQQYGVDAEPADPATSEGLLALPATHRARQALLLRGQSGRELLTKTLRQRKIPVHTLACYQRQALVWDGSDAIAAWQQHDIDLIQVTSVEQLSLLLANIPGKHVDWLTQRTLVVPSQRLAAAAKNLGFIHIIVTAGASNQALLDALH